MTLVLDVSAAAAVVFREPDAFRVLPHLLAARRVRVPQLFHLELANVGRTKVRRGEIDWRNARRLLGTTQAWPIEIVAAPWQRVWSLARTHGLTTYDAAYLWLARRDRGKLLTLDRDLAAAAGSRSLLVFP